MDPQEVKNILKSAKESIKNKDFKEALRLCKVILLIIFPSFVSDLILN